ncbi:MAG: hypothetical protein ACOX1Q_04790 [Eubacteriales bacterium]|jgi:hypothetical protein
MKKTIAIMLVTLLIGTLIIPISTYGHEMAWWVSGSPGNYSLSDIELKWNNFYSGKANLQIHYDTYIPIATHPGLRGAIANAYDRWMLAVPSKVYAIPSPVSSANVFFQVPSTGVWNGLLGAYASDTIATTLLWDTADNRIFDVGEPHYTAFSSTKLISWAQILFSPLQTFSNNSQTQKHVIHELGHALTLGHPYDKQLIQYSGFVNVTIANVSSIMHQGLIGGNVASLPTSHDINDITSKY